MKWGFKQGVCQGHWIAIRYHKGIIQEPKKCNESKKDKSETTNLASTQPRKVVELEALMDKTHTSSKSALFQMK